MIPYQELYIYEVSGEAPDSRIFFEKDFLGCWNEGEISFLFFCHPHDEDVDTFVREKGLSLLSRNLFDYKDWQAGEELRPFRVENLVFCPPWEDCVIEEGKTLIHLDPCVVFGTGYHFTTRSCLKGLWEIYQEERPRIVLDLGTGTGILALAAAKWGAERVLAVDCNELAVETALRNVGSNGELKRIEVKKGRAEDFIEEEADLVCANLHLQVMESLLNKESFFRKRWYILSGLFIKNAEEIEKHLHLRSIETRSRFQEKNWLTLVCLNKML